MISIAEAIIAINKDSKFFIRDNDYPKLEWKSSSISKPTKAEIESKIIELTAEKEIINNRKAEYGTELEQLEFIVENGIEEFIAKQEAVKIKYPKGS